MPHSDHYDAVVIGGGFFGCSLALHLQRTRRARVAVLEREAEPMQRASYTNQARVHNGYHYPRSVLTGLRSRVNFPRFAEEFADCVDDEFEALYAVARKFSNVTAAQFRLFCDRIEAPVRPAPESVKRLFSSSFVEEVYCVTEYAFDSAKLKKRMLDGIAGTDIDLCFETEGRSVRRAGDGRLVVECHTNNKERTLTAERVFNCTYARLNYLLQASDLPIVPLKHELAELALVRVPEEFGNRAITIMCGPFFSVMPFPSRGLHSLYHVRYTLHKSWHDSETGQCADPYAVLRDTELETRYPRMVKDAERYMPCLADCEYDSSLFEIRTLLPISEYDDSRPILFVEDAGLEGLTCVLGGKIDNIYDMIDFERQLQPTS